MSSPPAHTDPPTFPPGRYTIESPSGLARLQYDTNAYCFYIEADSTADPDEIEDLIEVAIADGFELINDDECESEVTEQGWTRIYLARLELSDFEEPAEYEQRGWRMPKGIMSFRNVSVGSLAGAAVLSIGGQLLSHAGVSDLLDLAQQAQGVN